MSQSISLLPTCFYHKVRATNSWQCLRPHVIWLLLFLQSHLLTLVPSAPLTLVSLLFRKTLSPPKLCTCSSLCLELPPFDIHMPYSCASLTSLLRVFSVSLTVTILLKIAAQHAFPLLCLFSSIVLTIIIHAISFSCLFIIYILPLVYKFY